MTKRARTSPGAIALNGKMATYRNESLQRIHYRHGNEPFALCHLGALASQPSTVAAVACFISFEISICRFACSTLPCPCLSGSLTQILSLNCQKYCRTRQSCKSRCLIVVGARFRSLVLYRLQIFHLFSVYFPFWVHIHFLALPLSVNRFIKYTSSLRCIFSLEMKMKRK